MTLAVKNMGFYYSMFFINQDKVKTSINFDLIAKCNKLDTESFHPLPASPITQSQLLPSNLATNVLFLIH